MVLSIYFFFWLFLFTCTHWLFIIPCHSELGGGGGGAIIHRIYLKLLNISGKLSFLLGTLFFQKMACDKVLGPPLYIQVVFGWTTLLLLQELRKTPYIWASKLKYRYFPISSIDSKNGCNYQHSEPLFTEG